MKQEQEILKEQEEFNEIMKEYEEYQRRMRIEHPEFFKDEKGYVDDSCLLPSYWD